MPKSYPTYLLIFVMSVAVFSLSVLIISPHIPWSTTTPGANIQPSCRTTDTGWECELVNLGDGPKKQECLERGGDFGPKYGVIVSWGDGPQVTNTFYCNFPYPDTGKSCRDSQECAGDCEITQEYFTQKFPNSILTDGAPCPGCVGTCEKYPVVGGCEYGKKHGNISLEAGKIKFVGGKGLCY